MRIEFLSQRIRGLAGSGSRVHVAQTQVEGAGFARLQPHLVADGGLGADALGVHSVLVPRHHEVVDAILDVGSRIGNAVQALVVCLVLGDQELSPILVVQIPLAQN